MSHRHLRYMFCFLSGSEPPLKHIRSYLTSASDNHLGRGTFAMESEAIYCQRSQASCREPKERHPPNVSPHPANSNTIDHHIFSCLNDSWVNPIAFDAKLCSTIVTRYNEKSASLVAVVYYCHSRAYNRHFFRSKQPWRPCRTP